MRSASLIVPFIVSLAACNGDEPVFNDDGVGLLGARVVDVFPSPLLMDGDTLAIPADALPVFDGGTPVPVDRFSGWRTGFSSGQTTVFALADVNAAALPSWREPTPGEGGVLLVDLTDGTFLPVMAELDAHPDAVDPVLLVRPLIALTPGHQVAVVVTTAAAERPVRFDALLSDDPPASLADIAPMMRQTLDDLVGLGVQANDIAVFTTFPIDSGRQPLEQLLDDVALPTAWSIGSVRDDDGDTRVAPKTWRAARGSFTAPGYLGDDGLLDIDPVSGAVSATGTVDHSLYIHIPHSVADAPAGSVPIVLFGHGIFGTPEGYLDQNEDGNGVLTVLDDLGAIGIAMHWRGLSSDERITALEAAQDFGKIAQVPDRLVETNVGMRALQRLILEGDLLDDPVFDGALGQSLARHDALSFYGISLGGIEGAVQVGSGAPLDAAVLHVGGGLWSTMLERSTQWPIFELFLDETYPDPADRQVLYAASQLFWDPVDPISWMSDWPSDVPVLWQESLGDEQVPNMTTRVLVRSIDVPFVGPAVDVPADLSVMDAPTPPGTTGVAQLDPQRGIPADENRPPSPSGAHSVPRTWPGQHRQTVTFLDADTPGVIIAACGDTPCTPDNTGALTP